MRLVIAAAVAAVATIAGLGNALAADLPYESQSYAQAGGSGFSWTGFYLGANAGGGFGGSYEGIGRGTAAGTSVRLERPSGFVGGAQVGINYQFTPGNGLVAGVEGDIQYADITSAVRVVGFGPGSGTVRAETDSWLGTLRGRVGYGMGRIMPYVTAGAAFTEIKLSGTSFGLGTATESQSHTGWTVGAGLEAALWDAWTVKAEYLYVNFNEERYLAGVAPAAGGLDVNLDTHLLRGGVNYKF